ncbi:MAG: hypothetical protein IJ088_08975 [Clostridia bacterium]|nr:hypothetical protein [Clostridia bacterium]
MTGKNLLVAGMLFLLAFALLCGCSQSSPFFPINTWEDANCLLTVGRAMREGAILYRDIYEQKGPTLYALHALAAFVAPGGRFLGVFVLEGLSCFLMLLSAYRCTSGTVTRRILTVLLLASVTVSSGAFCRGDSAEEFCLPCIMAMLAICLRTRGQFTETDMGKLGFLSGIIGTIKFTILGIPLGICLCVPFLTGFQQPARILRKAAAFLAGMLIPILAWVLYFAAHGALGDFYTAYIHNNIFLYAGERPQTSELVYMLRRNFIALVLLLLSMVRLARQRTRFLLVPLLVQGLVLILGGRMWQYTILVLMPFMLFSIQAGTEALEHRLARLGANNAPRHALAGVLVLATVLGAFLITPNAGMRHKRLEDTPQGQLVRYIRPGASFLQYSHLDDGLYLLTDQLPQGKFFCNLNVDYPEMHEELDRYLEEGLPEYVLVTWRPLPERFTLYRQIAYANGPDQYNHPRKDFFLYERIDL